MDDLATKMFMADTGVTDATVAQGLMLRFGLAQPYLDFASKLEPMIEDDFREAAIDGAMTIHDAIVGMRFDTSVIRSPEFGEGVEFAMDIVHKVVDKIINLMENEGSVSDAIQPELDPEAAFKAIFGVSPSR